MQTTRSMCLWIVPLFLLMAAPAAFADSPGDSLMVVTGKETPIAEGDRHHRAVYGIEIPEGTPGPLHLRIYDADLGGRHDRPDPGSETRYLLFGKGGIDLTIRGIDDPLPTAAPLARLQLGANPGHDGRWRTVAPIDPADGEPAPPPTGVSWRRYVMDSSEQTFDYRDHHLLRETNDLREVDLVLDASAHLVEPTVYPLRVFVDEADQALGRRQPAGGDSGVSNRVYSMIAREMSDPDNRGRLIWVLASSRPDLIEVDLKRPGRVDVKLPLFPTTTPAEGFALLRGLCRKRGLAVAAEAFEELKNRVPDLLTPGAAEALAVKCFRLVRLRKLDPVAALRSCLDDYLPPVSLHILRHQMRLAADEATEDSFVPNRIRKLLEED